MAGASLECCQVRLAARLLRQPRDGDPEDVGSTDRVVVELVGADVQVGSLRATVEVQREVVRREDLAEHHRRLQVRHRGHPGVVDAEPLQGLVDELPERVVARTGDRRRAMTQASCGDRDVGGAPAEELG